MGPKRARRTSSERSDALNHKEEGPNPNSESASSPNAHHQGHHRHGVIESATGFIVVSIFLALAASAMAFSLDVALTDRSYQELLSPRRNFFLPAGLSLVGAVAVVAPAPLLHLAATRAHPSYVIWQPFVGGTTFVLLQAVGWTLYASAVLLALVSLSTGWQLLVPRFGTLSSMGAATLVSQALVFFSLRYFKQDEPAPRQFKAALFCSRRRSHDRAAAAEDARRCPFVSARLSQWVAIASRDLWAFWVTAWLYLIPVQVAAFFFFPWYLHGARGVMVMAAAGLLYVPTYVGSPHRTGRRMWGAVRNSAFLWGALQRYFSARLIAETRLDPKRQYLIGVHPHGIYPLTCFWATRTPFWDAHFPGVHVDVLTATVVCYSPLLRDIVMWAGGRDVSPDSISRSFADGHSVVLVPGGQREMRESTSASDKVTVITSHKGFVRMAFRHGVPLVPFFSFGEHLVMDNIRLPRVQAFFTRLVGFGFPHFPYGRWLSPLPRPVPMTVVVGQPIEVPKVDNPTEEQVNEIHSAYFAALHALFEKHKATAGYSECTLVLSDGHHHHGHPGHGHHHHHHHANGTGAAAGHDRHHDSVTAASTPTAGQDPNSDQ